MAPADRLRRLLRKGNAEQDIRDELESHVEMRARDLIAAGMEEHAAHREAARRLGNADQVRRECLKVQTTVRRRRYRREILDALRQDLRLAVRTLIRRKRSTAIALVTLALAIGGNTGVFTVVNSVLLEPLPYPESDRLVQIHTRNPERAAQVGWPDPDLAVNALDYRDLQAQSTTIAEMGWATGTDAFNLGGDGKIGERVGTTSVSASVFRVLGVRPVVGDLWTEDAGAYTDDGPRVALLSYDLWVRRYGSDVSVVGRTITLDAWPYQVVGVLPPEGRIPPLWVRGEAFEGYGRADVYIPLWYDAFGQPRRSLQLAVIGRLRPGVTADQAQEEMTALAVGLKEQFPDTNGDWTLRVRPLQSTLHESFGPRLGLLMGAIGLVLLIACANVGNLLLAEGAERTREMAVRASLGGGRLRLVRLLLTESLVLAGAAGVLGLLVAYWASRFMGSLVPAGVPRATEATIDGAALAFTTGIALLATLVFGLLPAFRGSRVDLSEVIKGAPTAGRRPGWKLGSSEGFVATQIGLTLVLLVGAGLLGRSFVRQNSADLGFDSVNLITAAMATGRPGVYNSTFYDCDPEDGRCRGKRDAVNALVSKALEEVRALPGVLSASTVDWPPLEPSNGIALGTEVFSETGDEACVGRGVTSPWRMITPGYFETMRIELVAGRDVNATDERWAKAVIGRSLAERLWPGQSPLDKRFGIWGSCDWTVVGVADDVRSYILDDRAQYGDRLNPTIYVKGVSDRGATIVARTAVPPASLAGPIRSVMSELDAPPPTIDVMERRKAASYATPRFYAQIVGLFALLAVVLAAVGLYGTVASSVARSTHAIGVRMALGARAAAIKGLVLARSGRSVILGLFLGVSGCALIVPVLERFLYGMDPIDPVALVGVSLILAAVVAVASYVPARRATKVDPVIALRCD